MTILVHPMILAAGFASLWMLAWVAAAGIPIAIHFFLKRQQTKVSWAAIELLRKVIEQESKRLRFEQWLLLLIRTLILVLFGLSLARPYLDDLSSGSDSGSGAQAKLWIFVLDSSYTMAYDEQGESRWEKAINKAITSIRESGPNDSFMLVLLGKPSSAPIRKPTTERERIITELKRLQLPHQQADIPGGLNYLSSILDQIKLNPSTPESTQIVLLSDFVAATWQPAFEQNENTLIKIASQYPLEAIPLGEPEPINLVLEDLKTEYSHHLLGDEFQATATIYNVHAQPVSDVKVAVTVNGRQVASESVDVPAKSRVSVNFLLETQDAGFNRVSVALPRDNLATDNQRHLIVEVRDNRRILYVESKADETRMIRLALSAGKELERSAGDFSILSPVDLLTTKLADWDVIVCNDLSYLDLPILAQLQSFVQKGGNLVIGFGPNTVAQTWNSLRPEELLGFRLGQPSAEELWNIDPLEYKSAIARPFLGFPDSGLLTTPIFRHWIVEELQPGLQQDLGLRNSGPLLTRFQCGSGWVACVLSAPVSDATASESPWNAMATWPSFVPLMQVLVQSLLDSQVEQHNLVCGDVLRDQVAGSLPTPVEVILPGGESKQLTAESLEGGGFGWFYYQTHRSGVYQAKFEQTNVTRLVPYCINLEPITDQFASLTIPKLPVTQPSARNASPTDSESPMQASNQLAQGLLIAVLILLVLESFVAWQFGRRIG